MRGFHPINSKRFRTIPSFNSRASTIGGTTLVEAVYPSGQHTFLAPTPKAMVST